MSITDAHEVVYDVYGDGTDIWLARWSGSDGVDIFRGDFINNRVLLQHIGRSEVSYSKSGLTHERALMMFCKEFEEVLRNMAGQVSFPKNIKTNN